MIQFYINSRPVPRAVARNHLAIARPDVDLKVLGAMLSDASKGDHASKIFCACFGVSVASI